MSSPSRDPARTGTLTEFIGLRRPAQGSLGGLFLPVLALGTAAAVLLGRAVVAETSPMPAWSALLSLILWQPLIEELLFRGVLQGELRRVARLRASWGGITPANGLTAMVFAATHLVNHSPIWALATVVPALIFGWSRDRSDSVLPALLLHVSFNAGFFLTV